MAIKLPRIKLDFPTTGLLIAGAVCGASIALQNKEGLTAGQTLAAIAGTAFQSQIRSQDKEDEKNSQPRQRRQEKKVQNVNNPT